jgi:hypothetical protein
MKNRRYCRIDYMNQVLILQCPSWQHEAMVHVVTEAVQNHLSWIKVGGSPDVTLFHKLGIKTPDLVLCDRNSKNHGGFPSVVFEVGYSQSQEELNYNAARVLFGSRGKVNAVVTVKVTTTENDTLKSLFVDVWRVALRAEKEEDVEGIPREIILTKENKPASPKVLSWSFYFVTKEKKFYLLNAKPRRYQASSLSVSQEPNFRSYDRSIRNLRTVMRWLVPS